MTKCVPPSRISSLRNLSFMLLALWLRRWLLNGLVMVLIGKVRDGLTSFVVLN